MKFSDLNKLKHRPEPAEPAPPKRAAPGPAAASAAESAAPDRPPQAAAPEEKLPVVREREKEEPRPAEPAMPRARPAAEVPPGPSFRELRARAREVYTRMLEQASELLRRIEQPYTEQYDSVIRACKAASAALKTNPVLLNFTSYSTGTDYLAAHTANTAILALAFGRAAGFSDSDLEFLGFCAMAHDIGMTEYKELYNSKERLSDEDFSEITLHTEAGMRMLDRIVDLDYKLKERAKLILLQTHERLDGSGYPDRLSGEEIDPLAQIIGIADVYEAMTHPRPWREALNPPDVVRELIEKEGRGFSAKTVKALIAALSIYPPNSLVALSTGEIARVSCVNPGRGIQPHPAPLRGPAEASA